MVTRENERASKKSPYEAMPVDDAKKEGVRALRCFA